MNTCDVCGHERCEACIDEINEDDTDFIDLIIEN
jgi:hypothetical protein